MTCTDCDKTIRRANSPEDGDYCTCLDGMSSLVNDMVKTPGRQVHILMGPWAAGNGRTIRANGNTVIVWVFRASCEVEYDVSDLDIDRS